MSGIEHILAIDPGSSKCGLAVVDTSLAVKERRVVPTPQIPKEVHLLSEKYIITGIVIGKGTGSRPLQVLLSEAYPHIPLHPVDENYTTLQAQDRYFQENPPRGLARLLPKGLRSPKVPIDDYVAVILAERYLQSRNSRD